MIHYCIIAGLQTGSRFNSATLGGTTTFARNTLTRCGSFDMYDTSSRGEGAIWLYSDSGPISTGNVIFEVILLFVYIVFYRFLSSLSSLSSLSFYRFYRFASYSFIFFIILYFDGEKTLRLQTPCTKQ